MAMRYDICAAGIPFSIGCIVAALLPVKAAPVLAALSLSLCAALLMLVRKRSGHRFMTIAGLVSAGICCHSTALLSPLPPRSGGGFAERAMDRVCEHIDSMDFRDDDNRALIKALVTGRKTDLNRETVEAFRASGTAHILALSGMHLAVLYGMLGFMLGWLGRSRAAIAARSILSVGLCTLYCAMAGWGASLVRALLFVIIGETARNLPGRRRKAINIFFAALILQLLLDPRVISSVSFQLSYLSVLAIITLHPRLDKFFPENGGRLMKKIWSAASLSISCQIFTTPAVLYYFGSFPRHFLISNLVGVPLSSLLMITSALSIMLSAVSCCPVFLLRLSELCAEGLILCMEAVSQLS